ncbi:Predicted metal-binding protein related to the C-terminal domain of SecA [uncultured Clostridium sp.]|nr:Predicted metal-binding protein related to the C-terminal domain of SecA [uncultured Clostridium sp.]
MLGRNDLCPCGSGKKYKKCCLNKDMASERSSRKVGLSQKQYYELYSKISEFSRDEKFKAEYDKARETFFIMEDEEINSKFERFFNTYFIQDHIMENKKVMTVEFFEANRDNLDMVERDILRSLFESYVSVYEVKEIQDEKILLKDCLNDVELYTEDINLLKDFKVGSPMIARVVKVGDINILIDITISISEAIKDTIVNDIKALFAQYEDIYKDMKTFLIHHTHILYKYIQQLLEPSIAEYLKNQRAEKASKAEAVEVCESDDKVITMLKQNIEEDLLQSGIDFWNGYKAANGEVKGAENGWAAGVEYYVKKEAGQSITQAQIAKKYEISPSTLGKRYKDLKAE